MVMAKRAVRPHRVRRRVAVHHRLSPRRQVEVDRAYAVAYAKMLGYDPDVVVASK